MLNDQEKTLIVDSFRLVKPIATTAADLFYRRLFELEPEYRQLFSEDMEKQKRKLITMLQFIVKSLDWMGDQWKEHVDPEDDMCMVVLAMGRRHHELYAIPDESYPVVAEALLWALDQGLADAFTDEVRAAWTKLYTVLATAMKMGARASPIPRDLGRVS